jgi:predicted nucleic acid-binding protein
LIGPLVVSTLARVEVVAAIWRKHRAGELDLDDSLLLVRAFTADYAGTADSAPRFLALKVSGRILEHAAELSGIHRLRAYDAVQLASALAAREADERCAQFATFDRDLTLAAIAEGFEALPAATAPKRDRKGSQVRSPAKPRRLVENRGDR